MKGNAKLTRRIHTRITEQKFQELESILKRSRGIKTLCELLRNILDNRKINIVTHDNSLDKVMEELSGIRTELHLIGININQVTRRFHTEKLPEARLVQALEVQRHYAETEKKVDELLALIAKLSEKWLPG